MATGAPAPDGFCVQKPPAISPRECQTTAIHIPLMACNACCRRSGDGPTANVIGFKGKGFQKGINSLCPGTVLLRAYVAVAEPFSDAVNFKLSTFDFFKNADPDCVYGDGSIIPAGASDLTASGVTIIPLTTDGFMVGKDDLSIILEVDPVELSDDTKGCAALVLEYVAP